MQETDVRYIFYENQIVEYRGGLEMDIRLRKNINIQNLSSGRKDFSNIPYSGQKRIEKRMTAWLNCFNIYREFGRKAGDPTARHPIFITLTLSQNTTIEHKTIQRQLLQNFIKQIKYHYNIKEIFWKAELQKSGRLHFHVVADHYIPYKAIQERWNNLQRKKGLTEQYEKKYNKKNPPSTHVKMIDNLEKSISYVMKYVSKNNQNDKLKINPYKFSNNLLRLKPFTFSRTQNYIPNFNDYLHSIESGAYQSDFFTVIKLKQKPNPKTMPKQLAKMYVNYYTKMYRNLYIA